MTDIQKNQKNANSNLSGLFTLLCVFAALFLSSCTSVEKLSINPTSTNDQSMENDSEILNISALQVENLRQEVQKWGDNYEVIYGLLEKGMNNSFSPELWSYVLDYTQMHLMRLQRKDYCHEQSQFSSKTNYGKKKSKELAKAEHFHLLTKDEARNLATQFELLKHCIQLCRRQFLSAYQPVDSDETRDEYYALWRRSDALQRDIIKARSIFISRGVISPYLAETEKWLFLAKGEWYRLYKSHTSELYKAVDYIATSAHKEWLHESNDETREQFIRLWGEMKKLASKREWEEFQVIVSLKESIDPSKKVGAEAWWNQ